MMNNEVALLMNNEESMKIFAGCENQLKLFTIHYSLFTWSRMGDYEKA